MRIKVKMKTEDEQKTGIAIALRIPIIIVVTKKDMTPGNVYDANMLNICKVLKSNAVRKMPVLIKHESDVEHGILFHNLFINVMILFCENKRN